MLPVIAVVTSLALPGTPAVLVVEFDALPVQVAVPNGQGETIPLLSGSLRVLDGLGRPIPADGNLQVMLEAEGTDRKGNKLIPEVWQFDPECLAKLKLGDGCYAVGLPWPKEWPVGCEMKMSAMFKPADKEQPLVRATPQVLKAKVHD